MFGSKNIKKRVPYKTRNQRNKRLPEITYPMDLPITARREEIVRAISKNKVVVITGETVQERQRRFQKCAWKQGGA
jgi:ATP-dependent helicase HrpA